MKKIILVLLIVVKMYPQSQFFKLSVLMGGGEVTTPVTTNLVAYYTPSGLSTTTWKDVSGNNRNLTLTNVTITANALNGFKGALFNGIDALGKTADFAHNQPITVYIVFKDPTVTSGDFLLSTKEGGKIDLAQQSATMHKIYAGGADYIFTNLSTTNYKVITAIFNGASSLIQRDKATATTGNSGTANGTGIAVGCYRYNIPALYANVEIVEIIFYSVAHDLATRTLVQNYLGKKYGLF